MELINRQALTRRKIMSTELAFMRERKMNYRRRKLKLPKTRQNVSIETRDYTGSFTTSLYNVKIIAFKDDL